MGTTAPAKAIALPVVFLIGTGGIALFAGMDAVMKGLSLEIGVYNALFWRGLAGVMISATVWAFHGIRRPGRNVMRLHMKRGLLSGLLAYLFFWGLARVPLAQGTALAFIAPIITLFMAAFMLGERIGRGTIIASLIAFAGVLIIFIGQAQIGASPEALAGSAAILASAGFYAWNLILMRQQSQVASPAEAAFFQSLFMTTTLSLAAPFLAVVPDPIHIPAIVGAALLATASLLILSWAYGHAEASYLAPVEYTAFIWAGIFGYIVFGEHVSLYTLAGAAVIVIGCVLAARKRVEKFGELEGLA